MPLSMKKKMNIVHLEDSEKDAEIIRKIVESTESTGTYFKVDNKKDFMDVLEQESIDLILSSYSHPEFKGPEALKAVREKYPKTPFIFVSGTMGKDLATNAMEHGASDCVFKDKPEELIPAIYKACREQEDHSTLTERKLIEKTIRLASQKEKYTQVNEELLFQNEEKIKRTAELLIANKELAFQNLEKKKRADELAIANIEKEKRAAELIIANKELLFQNEEKEKRASELVIANKELLFQNEEKEKRASELVIANKELQFQNEEKEKRASELVIANKELHFQNKEKGKRASELAIANKELHFQNEEKEKRASELVIANKELHFQNKEKGKRASELAIANKELHFQNEEKEKRASELVIANKELHFQNEEKEKRASELVVANKELLFQNEEKEKRASELIISKEKAEESDKLKTAFLQNMSHEIRTPLNGIIGFSTLLTYEDVTQEEIKEYSAIISQSGNRLIEIVNNVLDISKIETGQIVLEQKVIVIEEICADLLNFFAPLAKAKKITLNYLNQNGASKMIYSDEAKLHQILTNLINNAVKFTKSGSIDFGFETKGKFIRFFVKDTGIGIPSELHDKVFIRFIQAEQSMTKNYEGAGLGLAISKGLVELLGGKIWVESEIGKGTTFFFTVPDVMVKEQSKSEEIYTQTQSKKPLKKILIAEDDWVSFQYLSKMLTKSDVAFIHAENGEQAVELVKSNPEIDLILMDIRMPVMNGIDAARLIKQIRPSLPIIAQTAYAFSEEKATILSTGFDEYLSKPLQYSRLDELIKKYLK
jgi:signal transduction histidine kinase/DNA-binding response OmpR family regulator